jgi:hypothetical protein
MATFLIIITFFRTTMLNVLRQRNINVREQNHLSTLINWATKSRFDCVVCKQYIKNITVHNSCRNIASKLEHTHLIPDDTVWGGRTDSVKDTLKFISKTNHAHAAINWWITHPINILEWHTNTVSHHSEHLSANSNTLKVILDMIAQVTVSI